MRKPIVALTFLAGSLPVLGVDYTKPATEASIVTQQHRSFLRDMRADTRQEFHLLERNSAREVYFSKASARDDAPHLHVRVAVIWVFTFTPDDTDGYYFRNMYEFRCERGEYGEIDGQQQLNPNSAGDKPLFETMLHSVCKE